MIRYLSNKGGVEPVDFEKAILDGFAADGGLYVPNRLPRIALEQLNQWKGLCYVDLAFEVLSLFIHRSVMTAAELKRLLTDAYEGFEHEEIIPIYQMTSRSETHIMELFHGPTISFKDIGLAFLVNLVNFFLKRKNERMTIVVATTGDTGPAAAHFTAGKSNLDIWVLYPQNMITEEQERQMTTLAHSNVHPVAVSNCPDGGDDLDLVIAELFADQAFKEELKLSSVNSINWGRIMMQTVHYFYGYLQVVDRVGEEINMSVPSGAFGNLCAGGIARIMGLPVKNYIVANNRNACLHRIFSQGLFSKQSIFVTPSSAIDILVPYNFWRFAYFAIGQNPLTIKRWIEEFERSGSVNFDEGNFAKIKAGFVSTSISDHDTLETISSIFQKEEYLLDPHGAVAVSASIKLNKELSNRKTICLATAHPAKFPDVVKNALRAEIPAAGTHPSIENAKTACQKVYLCNHQNLRVALSDMMLANWRLNQSFN